MKKNDWRLSRRYRVIGYYNGIIVELTTNIADIDVAETQRSVIRNHHPELTNLVIEEYYKYSL